MENLEPLIVEINNITNNEYKFTLKSATLFEDADFCVIEIFYRDGVILSKTIKEKVESKILELAPKSFRYEIKYIKKFISEEQIKSDIEDLMKKNHTSIAFEVSQVQSNDMSFDIIVKVDTLAIKHAKKKQLSEIIKKYLEDLYEDYTFNCELLEERVFIEESNEKVIEAVEEEDPYEKRIINFADTAAIVGDIFEGPAIYIADIAGKTDEIIVCGKVKNIKFIQVEKKQNSTENDENTAENDNNEEKVVQKDEEIKSFRTLFKFNLDGFTGSIGCSINCNASNKSKLEQLKDNDVVAVKGKIFKNNFNALALKVSSLEYCKLPDTFEEYIAYKIEKPYYEFVKPEPIVVYHQDDLLSFAEEKTVPKYLQDKTFVCYDLETTGLHYESGDRIVEIGAIKIVNGKITEKFVSFVNPDGKHIDEGASATTGIYDEDVKDAPKDYEVLQDFYKFTRGAILTGYNIINFDNVFLLGQGKKCRYNFDNEIEDVYRFAQKYVYGVKNYKLSTISEKLGVVLDKAHIVFFDALATAEVFIKLAERHEEAII